MDKDTVKRWRICKDDDGHSYIIPAEKLREFDKWLETVEDGDVSDIFDQYRCRMHPSCYTFTDPKVEA